MLAPGMQLPAVVGAEAPYQNTADMRTRGWEVALNWRDMVGNLEYRVGFNLSDSKSIITKYDGNSDYLLSSQRTNIYTGETYTFWDYYEGKEVGEIWGYVSNGLWLDHAGVGAAEILGALVVVVGRGVGVLVALIIGAGGQTDLRGERIEERILVLVFLALAGGLVKRA